MTNSTDVHSDENPLVSVIIPCYNVANNIAAALDSILNQTYKHWEIICVDDGSTDDTVLVIKQWWSKYDGVRLKLILQSNSGACAARNKGLNQAGGSFIQFLDADDVVMPEKIGHQLTILINHPEASFIVGGFVRCKIDGRRLPIEVNGADFLNVYFGRAGITSSNFFRKVDLDKVHGWNEELSSSQEANLMFRLLLECGVGVVDNEIHTEIHDRDSGQISTGNPVRRMRNYLSVRTEMIDALKMRNRGEWELNQKYYESFLVSSLLVLNQYESEAWRDYKLYLPQKSKLIALAGLNGLKIRMIQLLGYENFFLITSMLKAKKI